MSGRWTNLRTALKRASDRPRWCVSGGWVRGDQHAWCAEPQHWTELVEGDRGAQWFPTWREAYAYADAMARSGR